MDFFKAVWNFLYNFFDYPTVQGLVSGICSTVVGLILGIPIAFWISRRGEATAEKENKKRILHNLGTELHIIHRKIKDHIWLGNDIRAMALFGLSLNDEGWRA